MGKPHRRIAWRLGEVIEVIPETPRTKSLILEVPEWEGHKAGQHVDVRLTAEDGYQAQRSYSIASAPEDERLMLAVDRLDDGEVSPYLTDVLMAGDKLEFRGPIGGYFTWEVQDGGSAFAKGLPTYWVVIEYLWGIALNLKVDDDNSDDNPADIERYPTVSKLPTWSHGFPANQHLTTQHNTKRKMLITDF